MRLLTLSIVIHRAVAYPTNFTYYTQDTIASSTLVGAGVTLIQWDGDAGGAIDPSLGQPFMTMMEWADEEADPHPTEWSWHCSSMVFIVVEGNVSVSLENESLALGRNDVLWVRAGTPHSPFAPAGAGRARVLALWAAWAPKGVSRDGSPPSLLSEAAALADPTHRLYLDSNRTFSGRGVDHYEWFAESAADPDILSVRWREGASLSAHYHAEGAVYVVNKGSLCFNFTAGDGEACVQGGEARWVRPGYRYNGEYAGAGGAEIIVLNIRSGPNMNEIPGPYFVSDKHVALVSVC